MPLVPKISLHIYAIFPQKHGESSWFLPAAKHNSFLQDDSITLSVRSQRGPRYQKRPVYNIFAVFQGKHER